MFDSMYLTKQQYVELRGGENMRKRNAYLKDLIEESGMTQKEVSELLEIDPKYLSMIVTGVRTPGFKLAEKISKLFGKTVNEIFFDQEDNESLAQ